MSLAISHGLVHVVIGDDRPAPGRRSPRGRWSSRWHVAEHGRLDEIALAALGPARAAGDELGALVDALLDQALDLVILRLVDDRADVVAFPWRDRRPSLPPSMAASSRSPRRYCEWERACASGRCSSGPIAAHPPRGGQMRGRGRRPSQDDVGRLAAQLLMDALDVSAASCATWMPARVEPVKLDLSTSGGCASAAPTPGPSPWTRLNTPAGTPASSSPRRGSSAEARSIPRLASGSGFGGERRGYPATIWFSGQFHGVIIADDADRLIDDHVRPVRSSN